MTWSAVHGNALNAVFQALTKSGIPWLVLRNHEGLPWHNASKDIDLGVVQSQLRQAEAVVSQAMLEHGFDRKETTVFQWGRCTSYFGVIEGDAVSLKIDLMDGFSWRGAALFDTARFLSGAIPRDDFLIPDPTDDATIMWLKPMMTGGFVKQAYVAGIAEGISKDPTGFWSNLERLFRRDLAETVWQQLKSGDYEATLYFRKQLSWNAWAREVFSRPVHSLRNAFLYAFYEFRRRARRPGASFLAVVGPDGVGKSTFIEHLASGLAELQVKDPDAILIQHFRPHILPNLNELLTGKPEVISEFNNPHSAEPASFPSSLVRVTYYWIDYVLGYWMKLRSRLLRGRTIIFDRYFYDIIVDPRRSRLSLPGWIARFYLTMTPKPDLVFFLDADADVIYARKQELPPEEIARQLQAYRELARRYPTRFVRLDARQQPETIVREAMRALVERAYRLINE
jgi:thymidylate kinase